ncbi:hypothetical protein C5F52_13450 [Limnohabitans sp. TS-CS-82]|nr:hypothetical protein C5F52_13450 [Limnohabitans sp. TS-CS-82]
MGEFSKHKLQLVIMRVYYLTPSQYGISNLNLSRLKISRINQLNDPFEFMEFNLQDLRNKKAIENFKEKINHEYGLTCFSENWRNPLLWSHYANKHEGIALGFDISDEILSKVTYTNERVNIYYDEFQKFILNGELMIDKLIRTKFYHWHYEKEQRFFIPLRDAVLDNDNYYFNFNEHIKLKEIILGVRCIYTKDEIQKITNQNFQEINIRIAKMAPNTFEMVE